MSYKTKAELTAEALEMGISADQLEGLTRVEIADLMDSQSQTPSDAENSPTSDDQDQSLSTVEPQSTLAEEELPVTQASLQEQDDSGTSTPELSSVESSEPAPVPEEVSQNQEPIQSTTETEASVDTATVPQEPETSGLSVNTESAQSDETSSSGPEHVSTSIQTSIDSQSSTILDVVLISPKMTQGQEKSGSEPQEDQQQSLSPEQQAEPESGSIESNPDLQNDGQFSTPLTPKESSDTLVTIPDQDGGGREQSKTSGESVYAQILKCAAELHPDYHEGEENGQMLSLIDSIIGGTRMAKNVLRRALGIVGADIGDPNDALETLMSLSKEEIIALASV